MGIWASASIVQLQYYANCACSLYAESIFFLSFFVHHHDYLGIPIIMSQIIKWYFLSHMDINETLVVILQQSLFYRLLGGCPSQDSSRKLGRKWYINNKKKNEWNTASSDSQYTWIWKKSNKTKVTHGAVNSLVRKERANFQISYPCTLMKNK